jgi:hypothetical protein
MPRKTPNILLVLLDVVPMCGEVFNERIMAKAKSHSTNLNKNERSK